MTRCKVRLDAKAGYEQSCTQGPSDTSEKAKRKEKTQNFLDDLKAGSLLLTKPWDNGDPQWRLSCYRPLRRVRQRYKDFQSALWTTRLTISSAPMWCLPLLRIPLQSFLCAGRVENDNLKPVTAILDLTQHIIKHVAGTCIRHSGNCFQQVAMASVHPPVLVPSVAMF